MKIQNAVRRHFVKLFRNDPKLSEIFCKIFWGKRKNELMKSFKDLTSEIKQSVRRIVWEALQKKFVKILRNAGKI